MPVHAPKKIEKRIHGTMAPDAIDEKIFVDTKPTSVFVIEVSAICAVEAVVPISIPSPGWTKRPKPSPRKADNKVKTTMLANTTKPIFPDPFPPSPAMAPATAVMTSTTTDIWIKLIKISPMNFKFVAHGPTTEPKIMPATVAMMIHMVKESPDLPFIISLPFPKLSFV